jgi:diacylglycerol kinase (ATP)
VDEKLNCAFAPVVSLCSAKYGSGDNRNRPPLAVIPFGTGNDMSRSLGWGRGMDMAARSQIARRIRELRNSREVKSIDVWNVVVTEQDHDAKSYQMLNDASIGVDAETALDFEHCRKGRWKCCFCCHCMSLACYFPVGLGNMCCKRAIRSYCTINLEEVTADGQTVARELIPDSGDKTLIIDHPGDPVHVCRARSVARNGAEGDGRS